MALRQTLVTMTETEGDEPFIVISTMGWGNEEGGSGDGQFLSGSKAPAIMKEAIELIEKRFEAEAETARRTELLAVIHSEETGKQEASSRQVEKFWQNVMDHRKRHVGNKPARTLMTMSENDLRRWARAYNRSQGQ